MRTFNTTFAESEVITYIAKRKDLTKKEIAELCENLSPRALKFVKKFLIFSVVLCCPIFSYAKTQNPPLPTEQCINTYHSFPALVDAKNKVIICRTAYVTENDIIAKIPVWTEYILTPEHSIGCVERSNAFSPDQSLQKGYRAELSDYVGSGYDQGHMDPDGDNSFNEQVEFESFILTNMAPQLPGLNRGAWKLLETSVRGWSFELNQSFTIYVGPIYNLTDKTIGINKVIVPHAFYKIVINNSTNEVAGWVMPQASNLGNDLTKFRVPINEIAKQTNITFTYPTNFKELAVGAEWPIDFGKLTKSKKEKCQINK